MTLATWGWLVLLFPLLGSITIGLLFRVLPVRVAGALGTAAIVISFICGIGALFALQAEPESSRHLASSLWTYASAGDFKVDLGIYLDPLSVFMVLVVTGVSSLIHVYSFSYMQSDEGYRRFFSYLNFFVFSMLVLVLAGNFVMLIIGWGLVGFSSYALISYWYRRGTATAAGMKAFVINVLGDVGLYIAAILIFAQVGALDYGAVFERAPDVFANNSWIVNAICLLILVGAFAKSAQMPFHTWLADAMEGPTPVSALIHAATMVTAGVYLIARCYPLFELAPTSADVAAFVGLATLIISGTIALAVTDLKRIIAYSTMSQIGYMFVGVSIGAYSAGLFHLMTHAFFKALLFMTAGSVIAAMGNMQNIDRMRGFRRAIPFTAAALIISSLALAGFPGMSGWFSKDEIMAYAHLRGGLYDFMWIGMLVGAFITGVYSFRIVFRILPGRACSEAEHLIETGEVVHGEPVNPLTGEKEDTDVGYPGPEHHIAEQAPGMKIAMSVLALLAIIGGLVQIPGVTEVVTKFLEPTFASSAFVHLHPSTGAAWSGLVLGGAIGILGILAAWVLYVRKPELPGRIRERFSALYTLFVNKWYGDELVYYLVVLPAESCGRFFHRVVERFAINGATAGVAGLVRSTGTAVRELQSGLVRGYAVLMLFGTVGLAIYFLIRSI